MTDDKHLVKGRLCSISLIETRGCNEVRYDALLTAIPVTYIHQLIHIPFGNKILDNYLKRLRFLKGIILTESPWQ